MKARKVPRHLGLTRTSRSSKWSLGRIRRVRWPDHIVVDLSLNASEWSGGRTTAASLFDTEVSNLALWSLGRTTTKILHSIKKTLPKLFPQPKLHILLGILCLDKCGISTSLPQFLTLLFNLTISHQISLIALKSTYKGKQR